MDIFLSVECCVDGVAGTELPWATLIALELVADEVTCGATGINEGTVMNGGLRVE